MNYRNKRTKAGISLYTMAKELGIEEKKYREVENKKKPLEGELVDRFSEIISKAKQINFDRKVRLVNINLWYKTGTARKTLEEYNYTQGELAKELGISTANASDVFCNKSASDDIKEKIYDFLHNPMNKKLVKEKKEIYMDVKKELEELKMSQRELADLTGVSQVTISYLVTGTRDVKRETKEKVYKIIKKLKEEKQEGYIEAPVVEEPVEVVEEVVEEPVEEETSTVIEEPVEEVEEVVEEPVVVEEAPVVEELDYKALYEGLTARYEFLVHETQKYKRQVMLYEKLIEKM